MRSFVTASALVAVALAPAVLEAQVKPFEGTVAYSMQANGMNLEMVHHVKGNRVRQEMSMPGMGEMVMLMDMNKMEMNMIMPAQQAYMTMDLTAAMGMAGQQTGDDAPLPDIRRTGEMETVAGHQCENIVITAEGNTINMCVASDIGYYFMGGSTGGGRMATPASGMSERLQERIRELFGNGFFPLKMTMTTQGQNISMVATSIQEGSVSDDLFVIPAGYTKMPGFGGGF